MAKVWVLAAAVAGLAGGAVFAAPAPSDLMVDFGAFEGTVAPPPRVNPSAPVMASPSVPAAAVAPAPVMPGQSPAPVPAAPAVVVAPAPRPALAPSGTFYSQSDLIAQPSVQQIIDVYPAAGRRMGVRARVVLDCQVSAAGDVSGCTVASEASRGDGFAEAALKLAPYFKMRGRGVAGTASLTVSFSPTAIREAGGRL